MIQTLVTQFKERFGEEPSKLKNLPTKQKAFSFMVAILILKAYELGYEVVLDEGTIVDKEHSRHMKNSLHHVCLAQDLALFKNKVYLTKTKDYTELGEFWESLGGSWGGRFKDGNHFSLEHKGVR
jgi:hypothetical protein